MEAATGTNLGSVVLLTRLVRVVYRLSNEDVLGGLRLKQYAALRQLRDNGQMPQQSMCVAMMMDANNLVLLLNELESLGFVIRRRDPADRRRHIVELTDAGGQALMRAEQGMNGIEDELLRGLDGDERATLRALLQRAVEAAGT
jgi:DNA-binding MarR family transcriptional regulator